MHHLVRACKRLPSSATSRSFKIMAWRCSSDSNAGLVDNLKNAGIITSQRIVDAMKSTDRKFYVRDERDAYQDSPQRIGFNATISAPHMHAHALEYLVDHLKPGATVLDVGCGSGYLVGILHELVQPGGKVIGIDHIRGLTDLSLSNLRADKHSSPLTSGSIEIITGDGRLGYPPSAPYDVIHVGAAAPTMPQPLVEQLKRGGRMFIPVGEAGGAQSVWQVDKAVDGKMDMKELFGVQYVPLTDAPQT